MINRPHYCIQRAADVCRLYIYDDVTELGAWSWETWDFTESETSAKHFRDVLQELPEGQDIELHINSSGGSVKEGVAIYNLLRQSGRHITGIVDGVAHSVAFLILQAADERVMQLGTTALIHNMWMTCSGNANQLRKYADDLDDMMESNRQIFLQRAKISEEKLIELMEAETYLTPDKALEYGLIDKIDSDSQEADTVPNLLEQLQGLRQQLNSDRSFRQALTALHESIRNDDHMVNEPAAKHSSEESSSDDDITPKPVNLLAHFNQNK